MVTKAIVGRLSGNPNVLDPFLSEATGSLDRRATSKTPYTWRLLRGNRVRRTLGVACACVLNSVKIILYMLFVSYELVLFSSKSCMHINSLIIMQKVNCGKLNLRYYKASGIYIAKKQTLGKSKCGKLKESDKKS